jgi:NAD(P)-dependent dehydrogenase (short-subunit alcohol dehydrogenase family)
MPSPLSFGFDNSFEQTVKDIMTAPRDDRLKGKVAIVTGAGSRAEGIGNGRATSVILARHGARVTLVDTSALPHRVRRSSRARSRRGAGSTSSSTMSASPARAATR